MSARHGMAWNGMAWRGTAWHGTARWGTARHGTAGPVAARSGVAWRSMACSKPCKAAPRLGMVRYVVLWCHKAGARHGMEWCGVACTLLPVQAPRTHARTLCARACTRAHIQVEGVSSAACMCLTSDAMSAWSESPSFMVPRPVSAPPTSRYIPKTNMSGLTSQIECAIAVNESQKTVRHR